MKFKIYALLDDPNDRVPVDCQLREYVEELIVNEILVSNQIGINSSWNYAMYVHFTSKHIYSSIEVLPTRMVKSENVKMSTVIIPLILIRDCPDIPLAFVKVLITASSIFLTNNFKKLKDEMFENLMARLDKNYILSFKYPAEFEDQKYEQDEIVKYLKG